MKVLAALVDRAGRVVSRGELFELVWGNQVVGEDALTRCISDIRADLRKLTGRQDLIETLPKRGYRWILEAREPGPPASGWREQGAGSEFDAVAQAVPSHPGDRYVRFATRGLTYLVALVVMAIAGVWLADQLSRPGLPVVAVLPVSAPPLQSDLAMRVENELTERLMELGHVELLSRAAVASRPENPFPFFYFEFGAHWVLEAEVRRLSGRDALTLAVVDARTGIVSMQQTESIDGATAGVADSITKSLRALEPLIGSESSKKR